MFPEKKKKIFLKKKLAKKIWNNFWRAASTLYAGADESAKDFEEWCTMIKARVDDSPTRDAPWYMQDVTERAVTNFETPPSYCNPI